jgi:hypothetical protein
MATTESPEVRMRAEKVWRRYVCTVAMKLKDEEKCPPIYGLEKGIYWLPSGRIYVVPEDTDRRWYALITLGSKDEEVCMGQFFDREALRHGTRLLTIEMLSSGYPISDVEWLVEVIRKQAQKQENQDRWQDV